MKWSFPVCYVTGLRVVVQPRPIKTKIAKVQLVPMAPN